MVTKEPTRKYDCTEDRFGNCTITRLSDMASCYLQGEEAAELLVSLDASETLWLHPTARRKELFGSLEAELDLILSDYDAVLEREDSD